MPVQIADVVVPAEFTQYITENSLVSTALVQSGVAVKNGVMEAQLAAGAESFTVPVWGDIQDNEANISSDDPTTRVLPVGSSAIRIFSGRSRALSGAAIISGVPAFGFPKMTSFVARISKPTFAASPL
jgi:hypothetical protein